MVAVVPSEVVCSTRCCVCSTRAAFSMWNLGAWCPILCSLWYIKVSSCAARRMLILFLPLAEVV